MPDVFPNYETGDSRPVLSAFVIATRDFLADLVRTNRDPRRQSLFHPALLPEMRAAWSDALPMFQLVANRIESLEDSTITDHGLSGVQLRFKLSVIRFLYGSYLRFGARYLRRLIGAIDTLLKSTLSALGAGEGITEIKEFIEHSLKSSFK
jgi:hypothetical protein